MHVTPRLLLTLVLASTLGTACDAAVAAQQAQTEQAATVQVDAAVEVKTAGEVKASDVKVAATGDVKAAVNVDVQLKPEALDLETVTYLVKKGKVKDAATLEKKINNPKEKISNVDIDGDGKVDKLQIVEVKKDDGTIIFEFHAIPSKSKDADANVVIAYIEFVPDKTTQVLVVKATYAPCVIGYDTIVYDYTTPIVVKNDTIVVTGGVGFYGWLFAVRPVYYGVVVYDYDPPAVVVVHDGCWPPGHCKHHGWHGKHKFKGKGKGHGKWH